jgi:hypothetical protein
VEEEEDKWQRKREEKSRGYGKQRERMTRLRRK